MAEYLGVGFSYVIDAIDSVRPKAALIAWCRRYKVPLVTTGGAGGQIDPTQIQVADLAKTIQDRWRAKLRERLKSQFGVVKNSKGKLGVDCVFSTEALVYPQADGSVCAMKSTAGRAEADGLRFRLWRGDDGDRDLRVRRGVACPEEDAGESAA
ncbi:HesA/MoeB/ThiF family protein [Klebsiella pneumoniae]|uniref:HesA/MoeB/ThiF family protein n=1 Tax=Klebsiella pneumoniae TaxID=573 RepID=A0A3S4INF5_KLEPN|nr:HesA/MoeB/ThiF family protein [Klebsiella pneumoniae]